MTERLHFHFSLSCIGEGNGNPLQCSCLENSKDGGAWWAAVYGSHRVGHDWSDLAAVAAAAGNRKPSASHHLPFLLFFHPNSTAPSRAAAWRAVTARLLFLASALISLSLGSLLVWHDLAFISSKRHFIYLFPWCVMWNGHPGNWLTVNRNKCTA